MVKRKTVVIVVDGLREIEGSAMVSNFKRPPTLYRSAKTHTGPNFDTQSGFTSILTGCNPSVHGVTANGKGDQLQKKSFLSDLVDLGFKCSAWGVSNFICNKSPADGALSAEGNTDITIDDMNDKYGDTPMLVDEYSFRILNEQWDKSDVMMMHLPLCDYIAHKHGFGTIYYREFVRNKLGPLIESIRKTIWEKSDKDGVATTIYLTSDHGGHLNIFSYLGFGKKGVHSNWNIDRNVPLMVDLINSDDGEHLRHIENPSEELTHCCIYASIKTWMTNNNRH